MRSSIPLFNALAGDYDEHFLVPHRRAYDQLAWDIVEPLLIKPCTVLDAGCGIGRWAERLLRQGHRVIGIEQAPDMAAAARLRLPNLELIESSMEDVELAEGSADVVLALGSLQYTADPEGMIRKLARWTRPGGVVVVLCDSLLALFIELNHGGCAEEALRCLRTRRGTWQLGTYTADNHLFNGDRLVNAFRRADVSQVRAHGLLVGFSLLGRSVFIDRLMGDWSGQMTLERHYAEIAELADLGKQLLVIGEKPIVPDCG